MCKKECPRSCLDCTKSSSLVTGYMQFDIFIEAKVHGGVNGTSLELYPFKDPIFFINNISTFSLTITIL